MESWNLFDDLLGPLNIIDRMEGLVSAIRYGNYRRARRHGAVGVSAELVRSVFGVNTARFALIRDGDHSLVEVEKLLKRYGIPVFGRTHDSENMYFSVKKRQARWAEYIMLNAGIDLANPTFDMHNPGYVGRHGPGWMPTPWAEKEREPSPVSPAVETPGAKATSSLDRLSRWMDDLLAD